MNDVNIVETFDRHKTVNSKEYFRSRGRFGTRSQGVFAPQCSVTRYGAVHKNDVTRWEESRGEAQWLILYSHHSRNVCDLSGHPTEKVKRNILKCDCG